MNRSSRRHATSFLKKSCLSILVAFALTATANAQEPAQAVQYAIPSGDLVQVINEISRSSGVQIVYDIELLRGRQAAEVRGAMTLEQALDKALSGSGLNWVRVSPTTISISKQPRATKPPKGKAKAPSAQEQQASERHEVRELEKLVVVGSRLGTSPVESALPIKVITRDQIDRSGVGNIAQVLSYLSEVSINNVGDRNIGVGDGVMDGGNTNSTTIQLRGLPKGTTLVLINGRRAGDSASYSDSGQFDLSTIPLALVERIEVLPAGSSAVYGGDGLAGVINIVLRRDANGFEFRYRRSSAKGYAVTQAGAVWGKSWQKGDMTVAVNWRENGELFNDERSLTADSDFRRFGGRDYRSPASNPGTVYSLEGCPPGPDSVCLSSLEVRGNLPGLDSPVAIVPAGSDGLGLSPGDFAGTQGLENKTTQILHLRSAEKSYGINVTGRIDLSPSLEAFTELTYTKRSVPAFQVPLSGEFGLYGYDLSYVPATNPFNPFGVDVGVSYTFRNTGIFTKYSQDHYRGLVGLRGAFNRFDWEISAWGSRDESGSSGSRSFDPNAVIAALASTESTTALNPFVSDGSLPISAEQLRSLLIPLHHSARSRVSGFTGHLRGSLFRLPGGSVTGLVGLETQRQSIFLDTDHSAISTQHINGSTESRATFGEIRVPIVASRSGETGGRVVATGAIRRESSDRFEKPIRTETIGLEVRPFKSLLLRSTYSSAFKPPIARRVILPPRDAIASVEDPRFDGERYIVDMLVGGGVPTGLKPESSANRTIGLLYRPSEDWSLSLTHWDIRLMNRLTYVGPQFIVDNEDQYPGRVVRSAESGLIEQIDGRQINIALMNASGVDVDMNGYWATAVGDFMASVSATYTYKHEEKATKNSPLVQNLAQYSSSSWAPKWKIVPRLSWDRRDGVRAILTGRYVSKYRDSVALDSGSRAGVFQNLGDFWVFDLNVELSVEKFLGSDSILAKSRLNFGATNLFNRLPDFCAGCGPRGYDASQYDIMGRTIYAEMRMSF